jgi:hypothetical protein
MSASASDAVIANAAVVVDERCFYEDFAICGGARRRKRKTWHATCLSLRALSAACAKAQAGVEQGWPRAC